MAECLRQIVPDRWAGLRKRSFTKCFCVYMGGGGGGGGGGGVVRGCSRGGIEADS